MFVSIQYFVEYTNLKGRSDVDYKYYAVEVSLEEYITLAEQAKIHGKVLELYQGIDSIIERITQDIYYFDRFYTTDGRLRDKPLRKPREIDNIGIELTNFQYKEFYNIAKPREYFSLPESSMRIYRTDDSFVELKFSAGKVYQYDSREPNTHKEMIADSFIDNL